MCIRLLYQTDSVLISQYINLRTTPINQQTVAVCVFVNVDQFDNGDRYTYVLHRTAEVC